jgi:hypothetical protein
VSLYSDCNEPLDFITADISGTADCPRKTPYYGVSKILSPPSQIIVEHKRVISK